MAFLLNLSGICPAEIAICPESESLRAIISILETTSERAKTFYLFMTRIGEGYKLSPSRNYTTFPALTGLAHSSRAKYRHNESLLEITNLTVKIQKLAQHIIKLINITTFVYYMIC